MENKCNTWWASHARELPPVPVRSSVPRICRIHFIIAAFGLLCLPSLTAAATISPYPRDFDSYNAGGFLAPWGSVDASIIQSNPPYRGRTFEFKFGYRGAKSQCEGHLFSDSSDAFFEEVSPCYLVEAGEADPGFFHPEFFTNTALRSYAIPVFRKLALGRFRDTGEPFVLGAEYAWSNPDVCEPDQSRDPTSGECIDPPPPVDKDRGDGSPQEGGPDRSSTGPSPEVRPPSGDCTFGNPCNPATGNKYQKEIDYQDPTGKLSVIRSYNSTFKKDVGLGVGWTLSFSARLDLRSGGNELVVERPNGRSELFTRDPATGLWRGDADTALVITQDSAGFKVHRRNGSLEQYDSEGRLIFAVAPGGQATAYSYNAQGRLATVTGPFRAHLDLSV